MLEDKFIKLVQDNQGFEVVHAYRDDVDHFIGGKKDHYWYLISKNGKTKEAYVAIYKDGKWKDQYVKGDKDKRKVKDIKEGTTISKITEKVYQCQDENWVKDRKGSLMETDHPYLHYVKGFGEKALDVSQEYGVNIGYNDLEDVALSYHLRDLSTGEKVEIFE